MDLFSGVDKLIGVKGWWRPNSTGTTPAAAEYIVGVSSMTGGFCFVVFTEDSSNSVKLRHRNTLYASDNWPYQLVVEYTKL